MRDRKLPEAAAKYFDKIRLIACLKKYEPENLCLVDKILEQYSGREDVMFQDMEAAYGENSAKPWLIEFYEKHNPNKINHQVDLLLERYKGREDYLFFKLSAKYSSSPSSSSSSSSSLDDKSKEKEKAKEKKNNDRMTTATVEDKVEIEDDDRKSSAKNNDETGEEGRKSSTAAEEKKEPEEEDRKPSAMNKSENEEKDRKLSPAKDEDKEKGNASIDRNDRILKTKKKRKQQHDDDVDDRKDTMSTPTKKMKPPIDIETCLVNESNLIFPSMNVDAFRDGYYGTTTIVNTANTTITTTSAVKKRRSVSLVEDNDREHDNHDDQDSPSSLRKKRRVEEFGTGMNERKCITPDCNNNNDNNNSVNDDDGNNECTSTDVTVIDSSSTEEVSGCVSDKENTEKDKDESSSSSKNENKTSVGSNNINRNITVDDPFSSNNNNDNGNDREITCCICLGKPDEMELAAVNCCSNKFCYHCITSWTKKSCTCPYCRETIKCISCVYDNSRKIHPKPKPSRIVCDSIRYMLGRNTYFKLDRGGILGLEVWIMTGEHADIDQFDEIPDRSEEVLDALSDLSAIERWGLTEAQAQLFEVTLRGRRSVRREICYSAGKSNERSLRSQCEAAIEATEEMLLAQQVGADEVLKCLEKYRNKRFYTRNDIIHSYYKLVGVKKGTGRYTNKIYYEWDSIELMEQTVGASSKMKPQNQIQYDMDLRSIGAINGRTGHVLQGPDGAGVTVPLYQ